MNSRNDVVDGLDDFPGIDRVRRGLADLNRGLRSPEALLLAPATRRLRALGIPVPDSALDIQEPETALYHALCQKLDRPQDDPYLRYNSWRAELASFVSALEHRRRRSR